VLPQGRVPYGRLAAFYFFYFASLGALLPYWGLYLKDLGLDAGRIGVAMALLSATKVLAPNLLGWIADLSGRPLAWVRGVCLLAFLLFLPMLGADRYLEILAGILAFGMCWSAALSQFEAVTLQYLREAVARYAWVRLWGSVGFIVAVLGLGAALDLYGPWGLPWVVAVLLLLIWVTTLLVPEQRGRAGQGGEAVKWSRLLWRPGMVAFLLVVFLIQAAHGPYYVFYSIYLRENGYSGSLTGGLWTLGVVAEILLFLLFPWLRRWISLKALWLLSIFMGGVRWLAIGFGVQDLWILAAAQLLHAATFAVNHAVAIHYLRDSFGMRHQGKGQALYSSLSFGLGGMAGSWLAGVGWEALGPQWVFAGAAALSLVAVPLAFLVRVR